MGRSEPADHAEAAGRSGPGPLAGLRRARDEMDRRFADPLGLPDVARSANLSQFHFARRFRDTFDETPFQYLQRRRLERAKDLLRGGQLSVTQVCVEVGFSSLGSFSATFKRLVGESPAAYRAKHVLPPERVQALIPGCYTMMWTRPVEPEESTSGEAPADARR